jgi:hypothetical protein
VNRSKPVEIGATRKVAFGRMPGQGKDSWAKSIGPLSWITVSILGVLFQSAIRIPQSTFRISMARPAPVVNLLNAQGFRSPG